jgi:tetratricopeptide (TPR) repeat protein
MNAPPGHNPGHPPAGYTWGDLVAAAVEAHGTLAAVAWLLVEHGAGDADSVERALRRLRQRGQRDGGDHGRRLLRAFGVPKPVEARLRWMGLYHSPFNDLPLPLCVDQVRLWDRPPVSDSRARVWVVLGHASVALRGRDFDGAAVHLERAGSALAGLPADYDAARIERALAQAYLASRAEGDVEARLDEAAALLDSAGLADDDRACFAARLADQRAFQLNRAGRHAEALAIYAALPASDVHPFASYRREAGLAYGLHRAGRRDDALRHAWRACDHAGDGGYTRLRAMGLLLVARIAGDEEGRRRALAIADRLDDEELRTRARRLRP